MNPQIQLNLALILFLPWYLILAALYWIYPRQPRTAGRQVFDAASLLLTVLASAASMHWSFLRADTSAGPIWKQVFATSVSYGVFLAAMTCAVLLRRWLVTGSRRRSPPSRAHSSTKATQ